MNRTEVFQILGMDETKDEKRIKNAYRERLAVTNPEDDPEGFRRLRSAYEEACILAREGDAAQEEPQRDTTPSGLWVERAAEIYRNIHTRQDLALWKELFTADCFLALEDEENCRFKLLRFLTEHFKLPTGVWKLLDKKLSLIHDAAKLKEQFPADFIRYILNKCEHGEDVEFSQFEGPEDGDYDLFLQYYDRTWQALAEDKLEEAAQNIENADRLGIRHPVLEICRGNLLNRQGDASKAVALMEGLLEKYPGDAMVCYNAAELLWKQSGNSRFRDRAAQLFQKLKEETDNHYMANVRLAEWYYEKGEYRQAKKCAEKVLASGSDEAFMELLVKINAELERGMEQEYRANGSWETALELCWCYLQDGKIARGIRLAVDIEKQLPPEREAEFDGLMAKLYVEEAEYEDSVIMTHAWEEALHKKLETDEPEEEKERDRDRLRQAGLIRIQCYYNLGFQDREQFRKAVEESKGVLAGSRKDAAILLEQAQILIELEEYGQCLELTERLVEEYQIPAAHAVSLEAYRRQLDAAGVVRSALQCSRCFPGFMKAYEYVAKVYLDLGYREELEKILKDAEKNGIKSDILNAYRYQLTNKTMELSILGNKLRHFREKYRNRVERGEISLYDEGLKLLTEYLYHYPDSYMFVERGLFHKAAHHYKEAREDFEKALALEPANSYALNGLSFVCRYTGDFEKALICMKRAALYRDEELSAAIYEDMAGIYSLLGDYRRALAAQLQLEKLVGGGKRSLQSLAGLAECRLRMGQTAEADEIYQRLYRNDAWQCYMHRVRLYGKSGDGKKAAELLAAWREKLGLAREDPVSRCARRVKYKGNKQLYSDYYMEAAWSELMYGSGKMALRHFEEAIVYNAEGWREHELLAKAIFGCIVCGDDRRGLKYVEKLRAWLEKEPSRAQDVLFNRARHRLYYRVLDCFFISPGAAEELLEQESGTEICHSCTSPYCKKLEALRILLLHRQGKDQDARKRLERRLEQLPQDEYLLAIRHTVFGDS